jgi:hypothetical protein
MYIVDMITDTDTKKLVTAFKKVFPTKNDLKRELKDQKEEIVNSVGEYIADTIVPMFDQRDKKIARVEKKLNLPPLVD